LLGLSGAREMANQLLQEALDSLAPLGEEAGRLRELAVYVVGRSR